MFLDDLKGFIDAEVWNDEADIESVVGAFGMTYDEYYQAVEAVQYHLQGNVVDCQHCRLYRRHSVFSIYILRHL